MFWYILGIVALIYLYRKLQDKHQYWTKKNVNQQARPFFILADNKDFFLKSNSFAETVQVLYNRFNNVRYSGIYQGYIPTLVLHDPDLIKQITVKDFDHFLDHQAFVPDGVDELWSQNLFALTGEKWRDMRATLSPSFTSSKMKAMFTLMSECAEQFVGYFEDMNETKVDLEMKDSFTRYANDVIATCAFGVKCDSLKEKKNSFFVMGQQATDFSSFRIYFTLFVYALFPAIAKILGLTFFTKEVSTFFKTVVKDTIKTREEQNIIRPDMIHLLMEARKGRLHHIQDKDTAKETGFATVEESEVGIKSVPKDNKKVEITDVDITAQALIFFFAGFETTSILMSFLAYELAINPEIQDRLVQEIDRNLEENNGKITYEGINKMKYLDMAVTECLRKWPPAVSTDRVCVKPYTIPATNPSESPLDLAVGDVLWIPMFGIHRDPKHYPNPDRFDPERFNEENRDKIHPYAYIPFGAGPRNCVGSRFALLEVKIVLVHILRKFKLTPTARTSIPLKLSKKNINLSSDDGIWLALQRR